MAKYDLETIRHSTAHLMAQAIKRLYPNKDIQLGIGPTIDQGFYYDIQINDKIQDEDLATIEETMKQIINEKLVVTRHETNKHEALKIFKEKNEGLKLELINDFPESEVVSYYTQGEFMDLCSGPHVENTGHLPQFFKLTNTAGAYWRGDEKRPMLQRIYAACFTTKKQLEDYLTFMEEAKKRDHRKLGKELELFIFDQVAPASPFFMPKGAFVYNQLIEFMRRIYARFGYSEVITPQVLDSELWHTSGHYAHYKENMYFTPIDEREFALKPMNCPCHMLMFKHFKYSYRDLPLRYADFGRLHRYEKSGAISGLTRVRSFCQDDAHIFIPLNKVQDEIKQLMEMFFMVYDHFGFTDIKVNLSTRPEQKAGDDKTWDIAENALKAALESSGKPFRIKEGDGAFYGPKIDIEIADSIKRYHQLGTIQLDFQLPDRFDLKFTNEKGELERPVVLHRALLGSLERFFGVYLEHVAGIFPFWLAPEQATIVPVRNENHLEYCNNLAKKLMGQGFRVSVDDRNESMGLKTRQIQMTKTPFMLVIGDKEMQSDSVSIRKYGEQKSDTKSVLELIGLMKELDQDKLPLPLREKQL
jgi:threonyl-tRNA synthetase